MSQPAHSHPETPVSPAPHQPPLTPAHHQSPRTSARPLPLTPSQRRLLIAEVALLLFGIPLTRLAFIFNYIPHQSYDSAAFGIAPDVSPTDRDQDGLDDQTDLLASARTYLATQPQYRSRYYATGYPDDQYGVCTDVVAFALLGAGYDLRSLVAADIQQAPDSYQISTPDPNIDFRRTPNLQVYFSRHAQSLTTDPYDLAAWQGGDIVVLGGHIGIISDRRNFRGVPFVLHHAHPFQLSYEEDILETAPKITGHYRL